MCGYESFYAGEMLSDDDKDKSLSSGEEKINSGKEEIDALLESSSEEETPLVRRRSERLKSGNNIHGLFHKPNKREDVNNNNKKRKKPDPNNNYISDEENTWLNKKRKFK